MTFLTPTQYEALDDDAFAEGEPVDAQSLDAIARAHNRLAGSAAQMFSVAWPLAQRTADNGITYESYQLALSQEWQQLTPPLFVRKRPGATLADFRLKIEQAGAVKLQVVTRARALQQSPSASDPAYYSGFLGAGIQSLSFTGVPVRAAPVEDIELWAAVENPGALATNYLGGSPATGRVVTATPGQFTLQTAAGGTLNYNLSGDAGGDFAAARYILEVTGALGLAVERRLITGVAPRPSGANGRIVFVDEQEASGFIPQRRRTYISPTTNFNFRILQGSTLVLRSFAGATQARIQ